MGIFDRRRDAYMEQQIHAEVRRREQKSAQEKELMHQVGDLQKETHQLTDSVDHLNTQVEVLKNKAMEAADRETEASEKLREENAAMQSALDQTIQEIRTDQENSRAAISDSVMEMKADIQMLTQESEKNRDTIVETVGTASARTRSAILDVIDVTSERTRSCVSESIAKEAARNREALIQALNEKAGNSREEIRELMVDHSRQNQSELAETMDQNSEKIISAVTAGQKEAKQELFDRIHEESVKNYRNVQALMEEQAEQVGVSDISEDSMGKIRRSFRGVKIFSGISFLGVLAIIVFLILQYLRII
ncbi:MAG: hypothetical protein ACOX8G_08235 [Eubacterium sp.]|jgi:hypothetical protein